MERDVKRARAVLLAQYKKATKDPSEYLKFIFKADNEVDKWYVLLHGFAGDSDEYAGGEYIVRIELPSDFPFSPPHFYFMTPNGVYNCEVKVCISIGEYHSNDYRAALGVAGFCQQLVSGMIGWRDLGSGINITSTSPDEKKRLAKASTSYNAKHHSSIIDRIDRAYAEYSSKWVQTSTQ